MHKQKNLNFPIYQIVGYKNTGKTTLMTTLINYFSELGNRVGTLKHHGHGGEPESVKNVDSYRHLEAGSAVSAVKGEKQLHMTINDMSNFNLDEHLKLYTFFSIDILLIEGYKHADFPKIVLVNNVEDLQMLKTLSNIIAVGSWENHLIESLDYFTFSLHHMDKALPQLTQYIKL